MKRFLMPLLLATSSSFSLNLIASDSHDMANKIRAEGLYNSHVMQTLSHLTNNIGPRLTNSPQMRQANDWTEQQLASWGLKNAHQESFEFGRGWSHNAISIDLIAPRKVSLHGIPVAWTPGTNGRIEAEVIQLDAVTKDELLQYKGQLKDKIVMLSIAKPLGEPNNKVFKRHESQDLAKMRKFDVNRRASHQPYSTPERRDSSMQRYQFSQALNQFLAEEKAAAVIYSSWRQGGLIGIYGKNHRKGQTFPVPAVVVEAEQYNLLDRLSEQGKSLKIALDVSAQFHDETTLAHNTLAEIPGKGRNPEIVMVGAHLDSWHASDGAVDNGAGVAVAMEAVRILKALNVKPNRTIRIALWSGEEQGLFGSRAYVEKHFASRPKPSDKAEAALPKYLWHSQGWPIKTKKDHAKLSAYFNMDNGSGKFRGIYTEGNVAVKSTFSRWFGPYSDISDGTISTQSTGGTDHESFDDVGLPGFQFIQDPLDYGSRLHHTHIDSFDHVVEADLKQASVIMAGFLYEAAMSEKMIARKPMPTQPSEFIQSKNKKATEKARRKRQRDGNRAVDTKPYEPSI
jgi:carboxypeptidase Q